VVHVFGEQARRYYDLERLWRTAPKLEIPDAPDGPSGRPIPINAAKGLIPPHGEAASK
jgi:hypothetical protein